MEMIEFEHQVTGKVRKFPADLFHAIKDCCLGGYPKNQQERVEEQVGKMVATFIDCNDRAYPIWEAAEALSPGLYQAFPENTFPRDAIVLKLRPWSERIFARYGFPVWLVGEALEGRGRAVGIRVVLPDADFEARFPGGHGLALEAGKQGRQAALFLRMNVDFKIQKDSDCAAFADLPRLRMDSNEYPEGMEPPVAAIGG